MSCGRVLGMLRFLSREYHQSFLVVALAVGVIVGAIIGVIFRVRFFVSPGWVVLAVVVFVLAYLKPKLWLILIVFITGVILMLCRMSSGFQDEEYIKNFYGKEIYVTGIVETDPETEEEGTKLRINRLEFGREEKYQKAGVIYVSMSKNEELKRGDTLMLKGKLTEGFGIYVGYMYRPVIKDWQRQVPGDPVLNIRDGFAERIEGLIPEPEVKLGLSYLLGMKSGLPDNLSESLRTIGLMHIVVASGAHLGILVGIVRKLFGGLSRFVELVFSILFVVLFMIMVGWTPSIMRAGVMVILSLIVWFHGRKIAPWRMILTVAAVTLLINPMFLIDLGWLFSFASFTGIMILGPILKGFLYGEKKPGFVAELIITTVSATIMTLPITLYYYGTVSLISLAANMLVLPTLSWAMGLVFLTGVVAGIPIAESVVGFLARQLLSFHIGIVEFFGSKREFVVTMPQYQGWVFLIYGVVAAIVVIRLIWRKMVELRKLRNIKVNGEKKCLDIANGRLLKGKKQ